MKVASNPLVRVIFELADQTICAIVNTHKREDRQRERRYQYRSRLIENDGHRRNAE